MNRCNLESEWNGVLAMYDQTIKALNRCAHRGPAKSLTHIALHGTLDQLKHKLAEPVGINSRDRSGATALLLAVYRDGNDAAVRLLLKAGADPNKVDSAGTTPLIAAVRQGQLRTVRALIENGALLNVRNRDGDSPLTNAATWGSLEIVKYLLEHGADPTLVDGVGCTAVQLARQHQHAAIVEVIDAASKETL